MRPLRAVLLLVTLAATADGQVIQARQPKRLDQWVFGLSGFGGIPVGEFKQHEDGGGGMEMTLGYQMFRRQPLVLRGNAGFLMYGRYSRDNSRRVCDNFGQCTDETFFYNSRYHNMTFLQIGPEIMATDGRWRPFAYALTGVTFFNSWANYGWSNGSDTPSRSLFSSRNLSSAYGAGIRLSSNGGGREMGWELAFRLTRNANATYLTDDSVSPQSNGSWIVSPRTGAANVLGIHLGFFVGPFVNWNERRIR